MSSNERREKMAGQKFVGGSTRAMGRQGKSFKDWGYLSTIVSVVMKFNLLSVAVIFLYLSFDALAGSGLSEALRDAPMINLPISVGKSSYDHLFVESKKHISRNDIPENERYYGAVEVLSRNILSNDKKSIFSANDDGWGQSRQAMANAKLWWIARLPCSPGDLQCFLLGGNGVINLVVLYAGQVSDFQLVSALQNEVSADDNYGPPIARLDTMFGEIGLFPYPETEYEKTGIFCSVLTTTLPGGNEKVKIFKRRITPEGKIENKAMPEGVHECRLPW